eukprot:96532_1
MTTSSQLKFKLNDVVLLKNAIGVVLYIGPAHWIEDKSQLYVGLELSTTIPKIGHNGTYDSHRYFTCKPNQGIILPTHAIIRTIKPIELLHKLSQLTQKVAQSKPLQCNTSNVEPPPNANAQHIQIHGILVDKDATNTYQIQLKDTQGHVGAHSLIIPTQYVKIMNDKPADIENEIQPLQLAPLSPSKAQQKTSTTSNRRRSSISGRKYSVTSRQNGMYTYWQKFIAGSIEQESAAECDGLKHCPSIKRIDFLMEYYDEWVFRKCNEYNMSDVDRMIDFLDNLSGYNVIELFNDYYHLLDCHVHGLVLSKDEHVSFECTRMDCVSLMRHYKDVCVKNKTYSDKKALYFIDEDTSNDYDDIYYQNKDDEMELQKEKQKVKQKEISQEIILQEILDKMHCFLCHNVTSELHKFAEIEMSNWAGDDELQAIIHEIKDKTNEWKRIKAIRPTKNDLLFDKFTTRWTEDREEKIAAASDVSIGYAMLHGMQQSKYNNLKNEMLSITKQYVLTVGSWSDVYDLSLIIKECDKSRKMSMCSRQMVSIEFIICLVLYCNYLQIRNEFVDGKRRAEFANMSRILRQNVAIFGAEVGANERLYHSIEWRHVHSLLSAKKWMFCGSMSMTHSALTTILFDAAAHVQGDSSNRLVFCQQQRSDGIVVNESCKSMNCLFVNQFEFENEMLLMNEGNGNTVFFITNIVNVRSEKNYICYFNAFKLFSFVFMDNNAANDLKYGLLFDNCAKQKLLMDDVQLTLLHLLNKVTTTQEEIHEWFAAICNQKIDIKINKKAFLNLCDAIQNAMGFEHSKSISLHKICDICPNLNAIESDCIVLNDANVDFILNEVLLLQGNNDSSIKKHQLKAIHIDLNNTHSPNLQTIRNKYKKLKGNCAWSLNLDGNALKLNVIPILDHVPLNLDGKVAV